MLIVLHLILAPGHRFSLPLFPSQLFDRWCTEAKNAVLIPGYSVEGTLAKKILSSPLEVTGIDGRVRQMNCAVDQISFSAHVDFVQNKTFIYGVEVRLRDEGNGSFYFVHRCVYGGVGLGL